VTRATDNRAGSDKLTGDESGALGGDSQELQTKLRALERALDLRQQSPTEVLAEVDLLLTGAEPTSQDAYELRLLRAACLRLLNRVAECSEELELVLAECESANPALALQAQLMLARQAFQRGELAVSVEMSRRCLAWAQELGDLRLEGNAYYQLAVPNAMQDQLDEAMPLAQRALELHEQARDERLSAMSRSLVAMLLVKQGRNLEGIRLWRQSLQFYENEGDDIGEVYELHRIGFATWCQGDLEQTRRTLERVLAIHHSRPGVVDPPLLMVVKLNLGQVELWDGRLTEADVLFAEAEAIALDLADQATLVNILTMRSALELLSDRTVNARTQSQRAHRIAREIALPFKPADDMTFALVEAANGDWKAAIGRWPTGAFGKPDDEQRMNLSGIDLLLQHLEHRAGVADQARYARWREEIAVKLK